MATDQHSVAATLIQLADTLVSDYDLLDYLDLLLERSSAVLDAGAGGVMLTNQRGELQVLAATDEQARMMELFELQRQEGPCIDCYKRGEAVVEHDLAGAARWPQFTRVAVQAGYHAVFAFPMHVRERHIGALNLFRHKPGPVERDVVTAAQAFAHMAAIGILQERAAREARDLAGQLQRALNSRIVIEQAKGIVAEHTGSEVGQAYQLLRWYARDRNLPLRAVASAVVAGELGVEELGAEELGPNRE